MKTQLRNMTQNKTNKKETHRIVFDLKEGKSARDFDKFIQEYKDLSFEKDDGPTGTPEYIASLDEQSLCYIKVNIIGNQIVGSIHTVIEEEFVKQNEEAIEYAVDFIYALEDAGLKKVSKSSKELGIYPITSSV